MGDTRRLVLYMLELVSSSADCETLARLAMTTNSEFGDDPELNQAFEDAYMGACARRTATQRRFRKRVGNGYAGDDDWRNYFKRTVDNSLSLGVPLKLDGEESKMLSEVLSHYTERAKT